MKGDAMQDHPSKETVAPVKPLPVFVTFTLLINPQSAQVILGACAELVNKKVETVYLILSTPGGQVVDGITLYNALRAMPFKLITHNIGNVDSISNIVFLAGEERYASPTATFMFHGVGFDIVAPFRLEEKVLTERLTTIRTEHKRIGDIIVSRTKLPLGEIERMFVEQATKDANFAKANGLVHDIVELKIPAGATVYNLAIPK
jgi:ATP-dependent Clp protease, protease subunit